MRRRWVLAMVAAAVLGVGSTVPAAAAPTVGTNAPPVITINLCASAGGFWTCNVSVSGGVAPLIIRYYQNGVEIPSPSGRCTIHRNYTFHVTAADAIGQVDTATEVHYCLGYE